MPGNLAHEAFQPRSLRGIRQHRNRPQKAAGDIPAEIIEAARVVRRQHHVGQDEVVREMWGDLLAAIAAKHGLNPRAEFARRDECGRFRGSVGRGQAGYAEIDGERDHHSRIPSGTGSGFQPLHDTAGRLPAQDTPSQIRHHRYAITGHRSPGSHSPRLCRRSMRRMVQSQCPGGLRAGWKGPEGAVRRLATAHSRSKCTQSDFSFLQEDFIECSVFEAVFGPLV